MILGHCMISVSVVFLGNPDGLFSNHLIDSLEVLCCLILRGFFVSVHDNYIENKTNNH